MEIKDTILGQRKKKLATRSTCDLKEPSEGPNIAVRSPKPVSLPWGGLPAYLLN